MYSRVVEALTEEIKKLDEIIAKAEKSLENAPDGILRISKNKNTFQYYNRQNEKDRNGRYIRKNELGMVYDLAQKEYDKNILIAAKEQREKIVIFLKKYIPDKLSAIYDNLPEGRRLITTPYILSDDKYVKRWENRVYTGKDFDDDTPEIYTEKGERVRSKSEKIIADKYNLMNIPYLYEYPLYLNGYGVVYPDFTVLNKRTRREYYHEHFGRMDDPKYVENVMRKIESYERNGIYPGERLLMTFETSKSPVNMNLFEQFIRKYLT